MEHPQKVSQKVSWRSDLIWLIYLGSKNVYLFVCLFVCLFIFFVFFCFNHSETPTENFLENFVKIWLDLAEILRTGKLDWRDGGGGEEGGKKGKRGGGILLCNGLIILELPQEYTLKISWRSHLIWLRY